METSSTPVVGKRNFTIDLFRYICAIMVVAIHSHPFEGWNSTLEDVIMQICGIAVPFFFCVAGYFFFQKSVSAKKMQLKYITRLLIPYCFWSGIYFILQFILIGHEDILAFIKESLMDFFFCGSYYHLWFFPALIYTSIFFSIVSFITKGKCMKWLVLAICLVPLVLCSTNISLPIPYGSIQTCFQNTLSAIFYVSMGG